MFGSNEKIDEQLEGDSIADPVDSQTSTDDEVKRLQSERDSLMDRLARTQAEFENYRKRAGREQADYRDYALTDAARSLLPVLDSFQLALATAGDGEGELRKGVELIQRQLEEALAKMGVKKISPEGQAFDPHSHEAIEVVQTNDAADNHIVAVLQPGYKIKERLLRPAMVRVARNKE
jgi:molecular chaperone GrpE